jgi:hypothetical protein
MSPVIPFGGHKQSGLGVEWGVSGMKGMCNQQTVNIHLDQVVQSDSNDLILSAQCLLLLKLLHAKVSIQLSSCLAA